MFTSIMLSSWACTTTWLVVFSGILKLRFVIWGDELSLRGIFYCLFLRGLLKTWLVLFDLLNAKLVMEGEEFLWIGLSNFFILGLLKT